MKMNKFHSTKLLSWCSFRIKPLISPYIFFVGVQNQNKIFQMMAMLLWSFVLLKTRYDIVNISPARCFYRLVGISPPRTALSGNLDVLPKKTDLEFKLFMI